MKELRTTTIEPSGVSDLTLVGRPVAFDVPTTIHLEGGGSFTEVIRRGALDECDLSDVSLKVNHEDRMVPLARTPRTLHLEVTDEGLYMRASLAGDNPQAQQVYSAVRRGDLHQMSFAFTVPEGGSSYDAETNTRTISRISKVYECSICEHGAYGDSASVEARDAITAARAASAARAAGRAARIVALARASRITTI